MVLSQGGSVRYRRGSWYRGHLRCFVVLARVLVHSKGLNFGNRERDVLQGRFRANLWRESTSPAPGRKLQRSGDCSAGAIWRAGQEPGLNRLVRCTCQGEVLMRQFTIAAATVGIAALISAAPAAAEAIFGGPVQQNGKCWHGKNHSSSSESTWGYWESCAERASQSGRRGGGAAPQATTHQRS
jgi:hypothetical protein